MSKTLFWLMVFFFASFSMQSQEAFSDKDCQQFVHIYMSQKATANKTAPSPPLSKYQVSQQRYSEIFNARLKDEKVELASNEVELLEAVSALQTEFLNQRTAALVGVCKERELPITVYQQILKRYQSEIKFQRYLKPYFDHYLKNAKG